MRWLSKPLPDFANCAECRTLSTAPVAPRPGGLPDWVCTSCGHRMTESQPPAPAEDGRRRKEMIRRLASRSKAVREGEVAALVAFGDDAVPVAIGLLRDWRARPRARMNAAAVLGQNGGSKATNALLEQLHDRADSAATGLYHGWPRLVLAAGVSLGLVAALEALGIKHVGGCGGSICLGLVLYEVQRLRNATIDALVPLEDPRAVGPLAVAFTSPEWRRRVRPTLIKLLPCLTPELASAFTKQETSALVKLVKDNDPALAVAALQAVGTVCGREALPEVEMAKTSADRAISDAAGEALRTIQHRMALEKEKATLLRASTATDNDSETLLRPAAGIPDSETRQLLRSAREEEDSG